MPAQGTPALQNPATGDYEKYTAPAWGGSPYEDLVLPSGSTILVKRLDLGALVAADVVDDFDKLSPTVEEKVVGPAKGKRPADRQKKKPTKKEAAASEAEAMKEFFTGENVEMLINLMARVIPQIVVKPKVISHLVKNEAGAWNEIDLDDRVEGSIYTDTIPLADQMSVLAFGMEGMDMEGLQSFREQSEPTVDDMEAVPVREDPPL